MCIDIDRGDSINISMHVDIREFLIIGDELHCFHFDPAVMEMSRNHGA